MGLAMLGWFLQDEVSFPHGVQPSIHLNPVSVRSHIGTLYL